MDWLHCNKCLTVATEETAKNFIATSCCHILCETCGVIVLSKNKCRKCKMECSIVKLDPEEINPDLQMLFDDPVSTLEGIVKVMEFQDSQCSKYDDHCEALRQDYANMKLQLKEFDEKIKILKRELNYYTQRDNEPLSPVSSITGGVPDSSNDGLSSVSSVSENMPVSSSNVFSQAILSQLTKGPQYKSRQALPSYAVRQSKFKNDFAESYKSGSSSRSGLSRSSGTSSSSSSRRYL